MKKDRIIRLIALISLIMFFVPTFAVSCSGETIDVSAMNAMTGKVQETQVNDPAYIVIVLAMIPIIIFVVQMFNSIKEKTKDYLIGALASANLIGWFLLKSGIEKYCQENLCSVKTNAWFVVNVIIMMAVIIICFFGVPNLENIKGTSNIPPNNEQLNDKEASKPKFCPNCGKSLEMDNKFCTTCGYKLID